jgi:signal transduction histidine kinase
MSAPAAEALPRQIEAAYGADAMQIAVVTAALVALGMMIEAGVHLLAGAGFLVKVHAMLAVAAGLLWWLLRRRRQASAFAPSWAVALWLILMLSVACHAAAIGPGDQEMTRISLSALVIGTGALILPTRMGYLTLAVSGVALFALFWVTAPAAPLLNISVPFLVVCVAFLIRSARRRSIRHRVEAQALAEALREEHAERLAADAATEMAVRLSAGFAHHFNNQLQEVQLGADVADGMLEADHPAKPYLDGVIASSKQAAKLTAALMRYSRRSTLQREPVQWQVLADDLAARFNLPPAVRLIIEPSDVSLYADAQQLLVCVGELVENAQEALPDSGGEIVVTLVQDGEAVRIDVKDNGRGFPPALIDQAAEPFVTSAAFERFGLGLATAASIATRHGGALSIASEPGKGSTVSITLPRDQGEAA